MAEKRELKEFDYIIPLSNKLCGKVSVKAYSLNEAIDKILKYGPEFFDYQLEEFKEKHRRDDENDKGGQ